MAYNGARELANFDTHWTDWKQDRERKTKYNLPSELQWIDGGTRFRRNNKKAKFLKSYKRLEIVETHDCQRLEGTWLIEEDGLYSVVAMYDEVPNQSNIIISAMVLVFGHHIFFSIWSVIMLGYLPLKVFIISFIRSYYCCFWSEYNGSIPSSLLPLFCLVDSHFGRWIQIEIRKKYVASNKTSIPIFLCISKSKSISTINNMICNINKMVYQYYY